MMIVVTIRVITRVIIRKFAHLYSLTLYNAHKCLHQGIFVDHYVMIITVYKSNSRPIRVTVPTL